MTDDAAWRDVLDQLPTAVLVLSTEGEARYWNPAMRLLVPALDEWSATSGRPAPRLCDLVDPEDAPSVLVALSRPGAVDPGGLAPGVEFRVCSDAGDVRHLRATFVASDALRGHGEVVGTIVDRTDEHLREQRLRHQATHDALTGLANRTLLEQHVRALEGVVPSVIAVDLDRFKPVNDLHGHAAGDLVLQVVANRLRDCTRSGDLVCRVGGDEFVLLVPDADPDGLHALAERVLASLHRPVTLRPGVVVDIGASVGVAHGVAGVPVCDLLAWADVAVYRAKAAGRGRVVRSITPGPDCGTCERVPGTPDCVSCAIETVVPVRLLPLTERAVPAG